MGNSINYGSRNIGRHGLSTRVKANIQPEVQRTLEGSELEKLLLKSSKQSLSSGS